LKLVNEIILYYDARSKKHQIIQVGGVVTEATTAIIPILSQLSFKFVTDVI